MKDELQSFRQPMITAAGIILGFALSASAAWLPVAFKSGTKIDWLMAIGTLIHIPLYTMVIYRMLRRDYPREKAESYYRRTLTIFITGILFFYFTIIAVMIQRFVVHRSG